MKSRRNHHRTQTLPCATAFRMRTWESFNKIPMEEGTLIMKPVSNFIFTELGQAWQQNEATPKEVGQLQCLYWHVSNPDVVGTLEYTFMQRSSQPFYFWIIEISHFLVSAIFTNSEFLNLGTTDILAVVVLCTVGYLPAPLTSTHWMPIVFTPPVRLTKIFLHTAQYPLPGKTDLM